MGVLLNLSELKNNASILEFIGIQDLCKLSLNFAKFKI